MLSFVPHFYDVEGIRRSYVAEIITVFFHFKENFAYKMNDYYDVWLWFFCQSKALINSPIIFLGSEVGSMLIAQITHASLTECMAKEKMAW